MGNIAILSRKLSLFKRVAGIFKETLNILNLDEMNFTTKE